MRVATRWIGGGVVAVALGIQAIPYGHRHLNPPVRGEPPWDSPATRALAVRGCFDCHSNQTVWPWYASVAPASWLVQHDVDAGRKHLNFSEWDQPQRHAHHATEEVHDGGMPPWWYPWDRLSRADRDALARGLASTIGPAPEGQDHHDDDDDD